MFYTSIQKNRETFKPVISALITLGVIIGIIFAVSLVSPIYYVRYLTVISGLIFFFLAFTFDKIPNKLIKSGILIFMIVMLVIQTIPIMENRYSTENDALGLFIEENIEKDDVIISKNIGLIAVIAEKYPEIKSYFYNYDHWYIKTAYKDYAPQMDIIENLSEITEHSNRIWLIDDDGEMSEYFIEYSGRETVTNYDTFIIPYHNLIFHFESVE